MKLEIDLHTKLKEYFGFDNFKGNQEAIIRNILAGKNTFVLMPTGGGKSLCYQLPALILEGTAIVISPLIALMKNQVDAMRAFSAADGVAHFLNSSLTKSEILKVKEDILQGKTKLLYVAPESLTKESNVEFLKKSGYLSLPSMKLTVFLNGVMISGRNTGKYALLSKKSGKPPSLP